MNIWKRIYNALCMFIGIICLGYVLDTLLFKFGFDEKPATIFDTISTAIACGVSVGIFCKNKELKKFDIYLLIIFIILAIVVHFFVLNWHLKLIMLY